MQLTSACSIAQSLLVQVFPSPWGGATITHYHLPNINTWAKVTLAPFNNLESIEKASADALLLQSPTLALGLVEEV